MSETKSVAVVGAGIFGLSLAVALRDKGYLVTVFDRHAYDETQYDPAADENVQAASFRASYGTKLHYQRLALESRQEWIAINKSSGIDLFVPSGMLRVQPSDELGALEKETLANMERDGIRETQFVKSLAEDRKRAKAQGWEGKLLEFPIPDSTDAGTYEAVLDSLGGFMRCSHACLYFQQLAASKGVGFVFGNQRGDVESIVEEAVGDKKKAVGVKTKDGIIHKADLVLDLSTHLESSGGSLATFKIDKDNKALWDKYSPENFPVITWKSTPRNKTGKDTGSVYVLPRTPDGLVKIGFRGIKVRPESSCGLFFSLILRQQFTNFQPAPEGVPFAQDGKWSIPMSPRDSCTIPEAAVDSIWQFVKIFLPEFDQVPFHSTKLCWYTDSLDNSFVIDYVPTYTGNSLFVCTGGSGHGAKFLPVLGKHAADILQNGDKATSFLRPFWRWRPDAPRRNGLEDGPDCPRNIGQT
ncbi:FAD dependent oxidoreductase [Cordyceps fumosorosea ARSEF 2679]|uniref:FAD dependent oxidoreductase n=1 Tax=Cordyceps fumosorosea (strain ARSEF 2679) TaxID=1081104 RepID=A0A167NWM4_CORFA|nr:FAD dependent oxidoreductase [Cordyceps fumosorosea ARSEF 2679]OAA56023.1 FAD dependent oxidoreductase [Cordyceps fumosorosea ARSEF 2679]